MKKLIYVIGFLGFYQTSAVYQPEIKMLTGNLGSFRIAIVPADVRKMGMSNLNLGGYYV